MEKYLIIVDLDGTLMLDFSNYEKTAVEYLKYLHQLGHQVVIATGRPLRSSLFVYQAIGLDTPIINYNGALVTNPTDQTYPITDFRIDKEALLTIVDFIKPYLINAFCEIHDHIFVINHNTMIHDYLHVDGGTLSEGNFEDILYDNPNGALLFVDDMGVDTLLAFVEKHYSSTLRARHWRIFSDNIVEIYHIKVNKGSAVKSVMDKYHITKDHVIAIGDGLNDLELFDVASIKVAVANATPALKDKATVITNSVNELGVYNFLKAFFEKKTI